MKSTLFRLLGFAIVVAGAAVPFWAQSDGFDQDAVVLTYHKITGEPLDLGVVAERSEVVRRASNFDRPDAVKAETARLQAQLNASDPSREFVITVSDSISQYDHDRGEFSISLFMPGYYVPVQSFGQQYQLVFANAEGVRAIPMPKEEARAFDGRLNQMGRQVNNEIHFRVIGKGDPAGGVVGARVVRAEVTSARLLDRTGNVVFTPNVTPFQNAKAASGPAFDVTQADVAGFRVGVKAKDLEATLTRLFGPAQRSKPNRTDWFASKLAVNETGCMSMFGQDRSKHSWTSMTSSARSGWSASSPGSIRKFSASLWSRSMVRWPPPSTAAALLHWAGDPTSIRGSATVSPHRTTPSLRTTSPIPTLRAGAVMRFRRCELYSISWTHNGRRGESRSDSFSPSHKHQSH